MELLTLKELCELLQCSQQTIWRKRRDNKLPSPVESMLPSLRWRKADIIEWLSDERSI